MKVALSFHGCHRKGGVERIVFECARFLATKRHDVTVLAHDWEEDTSVALRYQYVPMQSQPPALRALSYFRESSRALQELEYDVLNTHGCVCPTGGVLWVQSVHKAWLQRSREFRNSLSLSRMRQRLNPLHPVLLRLEERHYGQRNYRKLIATTEEVRQDLKSCYGVPESDVVVIPNGFAPNEFNPERRLQRRAEAREELGLKPEHLVLLFVANELERKGYRTILEAMKRLNRPELRLLAVGKPPVQLVMQEAAQFGLAEQVLACGATQDVAKFHAASDLFVLPTQYEAFCLAILEALGSGLPVVTSDVPGARDAIELGVNGDLISDPRDSAQLAAALEPFLECDVRMRYTAQAAPSVRQYQWQTVLARYEEALLQHTK